MRWADELAQDLRYAQRSPGSVGTLELSVDVRMLLFATGISLLAALASGTVL